MEEMFPHSCHSWMKKLFLFHMHILKLKRALLHKEGFASYEYSHMNFRNFEIISHICASSRAFIYIYIRLNVHLTRVFNCLIQTCPRPMRSRGYRTSRPRTKSIQPVLRVHLSRVQVALVVGLGRTVPAHVDQLVLALQAEWGLQLGHVGRRGIWRRLSLVFQRRRPLRCLRRLRNHSDGLRQRQAHVRVRRQARPPRLRLRRRRWSATLCLQSNGSWKLCWLERRFLPLQTGAHQL